MNRDVDSGRTGFIYGMLLVGLLFYFVDLFLSLAGPAFFTHGVSYLGSCTDTSPAIFFERMWSHTYYPPLYFGFTDLACLLVGDDYMRVIAVNALLVPLGAIYLTALARRMRMGTFAFLPGLLLLLFPGTGVAARMLAIEMPLMLFGPALAYHLWASDGFQDRKHALAAGAWLGLGMLTKWAFPAYLSGFALFILATRFVQWRKRIPATPGRTQWINLGLCLLVTLAISGWWYVLRLDVNTFLASAANDPNYLEFSYTRSLWNYARTLGWATAQPLIPPVLIVMAVGLLLSVRPASIILAVLLGLLLPLAIFAIPVHGELRYTFPLLPAAAMVLSMVAAQARWPAAGIIVAAALVGLTAHSHFGFFEIDRNRLQMGIRAESGLFVNYIADLAGEPERPLEATVHPIWRNEHLKCEYLQYEVRRRDASGRIHVTCSRGKEYARYSRRLRSGYYDFILLDCGPEGDCRNTRREALDVIVRTLERYGNVNQMSGEPSVRFTRDNVLEDLSYMQDHYHEMLFLPFSDGTGTRIWMANDPARERRGTALVN